MATPNRTWTIDPNRAFADQAVQAAQFREVLIALKNIFVAAGWIVQSSSNGVVANTSDNWNTTADITIDLLPAGGATNGSWIVFRSPLGWLPSTQQIDLLLYVNESNTTNPKSAPIRIAPQFYDTDGTIDTQLPTPLVDQTTLPGVNLTDIIPWTLETDGRWNSWYTSVGDIMFGVKQEGQPFFRYFMFLSANTGSGSTDGQGAFRFFFGISASVTSDVLVIPSTSSIHWKTSTPTGLAGNASLEYETKAITSWVNGYDYKGETKIVEGHGFHVVNNFCRNLGRMFGGDVGVGVQNTPFGTLHSPEKDQVLRRICISGFWVYFPDAARPIQ